MGWLSGLRLKGTATRMPVSGSGVWLARRKAWMAPVAAAMSTSLTVPFSAGPLP